MNKFLKFILLALGNEIGAVTDDINKAQLEKDPAQKVEPGEYNSRMKSLVLRADLDSDYAVNDEILGNLIPEGAKILDAYVRTTGTLGTTGIFDFGLKAGEVYDEDSSEEDKLEAFSEDQNALVNQADGGGQAVFKRADVNSVFLGSMKKKVGKGGLRPFIKFTEATTALGTTAQELEAVVFYSLEH